MDRNSKVLVVIAICLLILAYALLTARSLKGMGNALLRKATSTQVYRKVRRKAGPVEGSLHRAPILPPDRLTARRHVVANLRKALARRDFRQSALLNSILSQEALERAHRALKAWEALRDTETGLVPGATRPQKAYWNTRDAAADLFCFLLLAGNYLDKDSEALWLDALAKERQICGALPRSIRFRPTRVMEQDLPEVIFGASEYAKDGLLAVAERLGRGPWFERLEEITQALIDAAGVRTKSGRICSPRTEVNGEMLQVLSRLYSATRKGQYLQMAESIAEAYLFEVLPSNRYLPAQDWDFAKGRPTSSYFRLRDHGSEIIAGLTELYLLEKINARPQAARYRKPLKEFLDLILVVGRTEDGLWHNAINTETQQPVDEGVVDTWGYILNAYQMFDIAEGTALYAEEISRAMRAAAGRKSFRWEREHHDGYADAIESMLYLLPWFDIPECHCWVDDEIEVMFSMQASSGFVSKDYLDGNFIRTALLYAGYKTQGTIAQPWREDVSLGAAYDREDRELYVHVSAAAHWEGVLKFDLPRHRTIWNLPFEYPRLNGTPEWFVVEPEGTYAVVDLHTGRMSAHSGQSLADGLPLTLDAERSAVWLTVSAQ